MATRKEIEAHITRSLGLSKFYGGGATQPGADDALRDFAARWDIRDVKVAYYTVKLAGKAPWSAQADSSLVASLLQDAHLAEMRNVEADKAEKAQRLARRNELIDKLTGAWSRRTGEVVDGVEYQKGMRAAWDRNS